MASENTIDYYNTHANEFVAGTVSVEFKATQQRFLKHLPKGAAILDFGCGSGRDTKYFLEQGYLVDAVDGSVELCKMASEYTGIAVQHMFFEDLSEADKYDGIWACASLLHLPSDELVDVMRKMAAALKAKGIIYTSFKYGMFEGSRNGRYFLDMTEDTFAEVIGQVQSLRIEEQWITSDARPKRGNEKWLNLILRKE